MDPSVMHDEIRFGSSKIISRSITNDSKCKRHKEVRRNGDHYFFNDQIFDKDP
jgi:hypothetical protein